MASTKVYLVPGFFGFTSLGALSYFHRVGETLRKALAVRGLEADVIECPTEPSGSITRRTERLHQHVLETGGLEAEAVHFVGHSTGGIDVRLLLSPGVRIGRDGTEELIGQKTLAAVTMSTAHHGTPLATFFASVQGRRLLQLAAERAAGLDGRVTLTGVARVLSAVSRVDTFFRGANTTLDDLSEALLRRVSLRRDDPLWVFLREVSRDQGIIVQLTPESLNLFNAVVVDRPTVSYSCIATAAPRPPFHYDRQDLRGVRPLLAATFVALHTITARAHRQYPYPEPDEEARALLERSLPFPVDPSTNDGVVPTLSQVQGRLIGAVVADHLDVVGQFRRPAEPLSDWFASGSHFTHSEFESLWSLVADELLRARSAARG